MTVLRKPKFGIITTSDSNQIVKGENIYHNHFIGVLTEAAKEKNCDVAILDFNVLMDEFAKKNEKHYAALRAKQTEAHKKEETFNLSRHRFESVGKALEAAEADPDGLEGIKAYEAALTALVEFLLEHEDVKDLDGFAGGGDHFNTGIYGINKKNPNRLLFEEAFVIVAALRKLPGFGVCGTEQHIVYGAGGDLIGKLKDHAVSGGAEVHNVFLLGGSNVRSTFEYHNRIEAKETGGITKVNSMHTQGVEVTETTLKAIEKKGFILSAIGVDLSKDNGVERNMDEVLVALRDKASEIVTVRLEGQKEAVESEKTKKLNALAEYIRAVVKDKFEGQFKGDVEAFIKEAGDFSDISSLFYNKLNNDERELLGHLQKDSIFCRKTEEEISSLNTKLAEIDEKLKPKNINASITAKDLLDAKASNEEFANVRIVVEMVETKEGVAVDLTQWHPEYYEGGRVNKSIIDGFFSALRTSAGLRELVHGFASKFENFKPTKFVSGLEAETTFSSALIDAFVAAKLSPSERLSNESSMAGRPTIKTAGELLKKTIAIYENPNEVSYKDKILVKDAFKNLDQEQSDAIAKSMAKSMVNAEVSISDRFKQQSFARQTGVPLDTGVTVGAGIAV